MLIHFQVVCRPISVICHTSSRHCTQSLAVRILYRHHRAACFLVQIVIRSAVAVSLGNDIGKDPLKPSDELVVRLLGVIPIKIKC